jgi:two-component sensor histidine kinase
MTLAQVYDHLLGTGLSRTIEFGDYLASLCSSIESLRAAQRPDITLICHPERVILDLDGVTALGLVISELISNSYEHAFPAGGGTITVSMLHRPPSEEATILFSDDGVGFTDSGESKRHGLGLVKRLMQQVNGSAVLRSGHGSEWTLRFPVPPASLEIPDPADRARSCQLATASTGVAG